MRTCDAAFVLSLAFASGAGAAEPLSAIDWLSDSIAAAPPPAVPPPPAGAAIPEVETRPLGQSLPDGLGLLSAEAAGLPRGLWRGATMAELIRLFETGPRDLLPSPRALLKRVLLAELDPPGDAAPTGRFLIARIDRLLELGALDEAAALLDTAGTASPDLFRRRFDVALLIGREAQACAELRDNPSVSPTYPARIFCLAQTGEWHTAAVTLETAKALGLLSAEEDDLLARFLHPELAEELPPLGPPVRPSPLMFRLYAAVGEPLPTSPLPLPFAYADLDPNTGWKGKLEAAERLARAGALDPNLLLGLYTERRPSASGGVWERAQAVQRLEAALAAPEASPELSARFLAARAVFDAAGLTPVFAELFANRLDAGALTPEARTEAFRLRLLTGDYLIAALRHTPADDEDRFLVSVALGRAGETPAPNALAQAVAAGFAASELPERANGFEARGVALLRSLGLFTSGAKGNYRDLSDAISHLRIMGFETAARRAALELLILAEPA